MFLRSRRLCCTSLAFWLWPQPSGVCVFSFSLYTLSKMFSLCSSFLLFFPPPLLSSLPPPCVPCRTEPQILKILPLVYLACVCLSFSLSLAMYISRFSSLISFLFPFYLSSASRLTLRSIRFLREASRPIWEELRDFWSWNAKHVKQRGCFENLESSERC